MPLVLSDGGLFDTRLLYCARPALTESPDISSFFCTSIREKKEVNFITEGAIAQSLTQQPVEPDNKKAHSEVDSKCACL